MRQIGDAYCRGVEAESLGSLGLGYFGTFLSFIKWYEIGVLGIICTQVREFDVVTLLTFLAFEKLDLRTMHH